MFLNIMFEIPSGPEAVFSNSSCVTERMNGKAMLELLSEPVDINWDGTEKYKANKLLNMGWDPLMIFISYGILTRSLLF